MLVCLLAHKCDEMSVILLMSDSVFVIILCLSGSFVTTLWCVFGLWLGIWIFYKQPVRGGPPVSKLAGD